MNVRDTTLKLLIFGIYLIKLEKRFFLRIKYLLRSLACLFFEIATLEYAFKDKDQLNIIASEETFFQKELPKLDSKHPLREVFDK